MDYRMKNLVLWAIIFQNTSLVDLCWAQSQSADGLPGKLIIIMLLLCTGMSPSMHACMNYII